jgi:hypothetical protein
VCTSGCNRTISISGSTVTGAGWLPGPEANLPHTQAREVTRVLVAEDMRILRDTMAAVLNLEDDTACLETATFKVTMYQEALTTGATGRSGSHPSRHEDASVPPRKRLRRCATLPGPLRPAQPAGFLAHWDT